MWQQIPYTTDGRHEQHVILKSLQNQSQGWCARAGGVLAVILRCAHQRHYRGPWTSQGPRGQGTQGIQMNLTLTHPPTPAEAIGTAATAGPVENTQHLIARPLQTCFYLRHLRCIPASIGGTCGGEMVFLLVHGAPAVPKWYSCLCLGHLWCPDMLFLLVSSGPAVAKLYFCLYLGHRRWRNGIPACIRGTCGGEMVFLLMCGAPAVVKWYSCLCPGHLRWQNDIPACIEGTCGGEVAFLLVSGKPVVAKSYSILYLWLCGSKRYSCLSSCIGTPAVAKWYSCLYLHHLRL